MSKIVAFLPCRAGSERVKNKNTRPFAGIQGGLLQIKLRQLDASERIDEIALSTNDQIVIDLADAAGVRKPLRIHRRAEALSSSSTTTDDLILHAIDLVKTDTLLWTHVTAPLVGAEVYDDAVARLEADGACDSLMSVSPLRTFIWTKAGPMNYDRNVEKWPRTQTLEPMLVVNSAIFICDVATMRSKSDRIGDAPCLYELDAIKSIDVDWEDDFLIAEAAYAKVYGEGVLP